MTGMADEKPGGGTPPPISHGSFVQWGSSRGRVDLVVTSGKVPGVDDDVEGSKDSPAVRVVVWEADGDGYKPGRKKVAKMAHTLKRIAPLHRPKPAGKGLVWMLADHEEATAGDPAAAVTGLAVKTVYDRGLRAWPGFAHTTLTREQWAEKRATAFLAAAAGTDMPRYTRDRDMLCKAHPLHPDHPREETVTIAAGDVEATLAGLTES